MHVAATLPIRRHAGGATLAPGPRRACPCQVRYHAVCHAGQGSVSQSGVIAIYEGLVWYGATILTLEENLFRMKD